MAVLLEAKNNDFDSKIMSEYEHSFVYGKIWKSTLCNHHNENENFDHFSLVSEVYNNRWALILTM